MATPGIAICAARALTAKAHSGSEDSIQWLGQQIANDPRFAKATVKFWWPSVFGSEVLVAPMDRSLPDYEAQLLAFNAQEALVEELATAFAADGFKVKSLLADMMLSPWFRTTAIVGSLSETQEAALETVGRGRQLTPKSSIARIERFSAEPGARGGGITRTIISHKLTSQGGGVTLPFTGALMVRR